MKPTPEPAIAIAPPFFPRVARWYAVPGWIPDTGCEGGGMAVWYAHDCETRQSIAVNGRVVEGVSPAHLTLLMRAFPGAVQCVNGVDGWQEAMPCATR